MIVRDSGYLEKAFAHQVMRIDVIQEHDARPREVERIELSGSIETGNVYAISRDAFEPYTGWAGGDDWIPDAPAP